MTRKYVTKVQKWIPKQELVERIWDKKVEVRILRRLLFIKYLYEGDSVPKAAKKVEVSLPTAYSWRELWNNGGYDGLVPNFAGGAPSELSDEQKNELVEILKTRDDWTTKEVRQLIQKEFDVTYSMRHVRRLLKLMRMKHSKPYQHDYRRPEDAEERLKKTR